LVLPATTSTTSATAGTFTGTFVGIDWGGGFHQVCLLDPAGSVLAGRRVGHDVDGFGELDRLLAASAAPVRVAIERAEGLLVEHLLDLGLDLPVTVYCVSPKISARARERYRLAPTKSDSFDAFVLADTLRHEHPHWRSLSRPSPLLAELRAVSRDREGLVEDQRSVESQLRAVLEAYHPAPLHLFSSLDRDIALAFLRDYPTPQKAACLGEARMAAFCARHGYSGRTTPAELLARLRPHLLAGTAGTTAGKAFAAQRLGERLALLNSQLRDYDRHLCQLLDAHPDAAIFRSFPGLGPVTAATLLAEMGEDRARYPTDRALLTDIGLAPVTRQSGRTRQVHFRYAANHRMRHAVDWWAFTSIRESDWARGAYDAARARGHGKYRALRGLGARWTRILWRCWTDHTTYDPARHTAKRTSRGAANAMTG
jgi:transposase